MRYFRNESSAVRTEVCLTVDVEFSIAGAFADPANFPPLSDPAVRCDVGGKEHGLGFILEMLAAYRATATFFVEALNPAYFGDDPMKRVAHRILSAGHDVQLHLHPCWLQFLKPDWPKHINGDPNDSCAGRTQAELNAIIGGGIAAFERWSIPAPIAVRAGNLQADLACYDALQRFGIPLASNLGIGSFCPSEPILQLHGGRHRINGVVEVPVLSYKDLRLPGRDRQRVLSITSTSWPEMKSLLWQVRRADISPVVVLTHPHEFVKQRGFRFEGLRRNRVNQTRLVRLLRFIRTHDEDFTTVTFGDSVDRWLATEGTGDPSLNVPPWLALGRMVHNRLNDLIPAY